MMSVKEDSIKPFSSLSYQVLLVTGSWFFTLYCIVESLLLILKKLYFVYPIGTFLSEVALLAFLSITQYIRNFLGKKGNLTERTLSVMLSLLLTAPVALGAVYFFVFQTYIVKLDLIFSIAYFAFLVLESLFAITTLITFER